MIDFCLMRWFLLLTALVAAAAAWKAYPSMVWRTCPVCEGQGSLRLRQAAVILRKGVPVEKPSILCPFCDGGRLSLARLRDQQANILRWMVKDQRLEGAELVRRVQAAYGPDGVAELGRQGLLPPQP